MKKSKIILLLAISFCFTNIFGQTPSVNMDSIPRCGITKDFIQSLADVTSNNNRQLIASSATPFSVLTCGRFNLIFEDVILGSGYGFADLVSGADRQQCVCDAVNYIQTIFEIPIGDGSPIEILIEESWNSTTNPPPTPSALAVAGPLFTSTNFLSGVDGFYGGNVYDHFTTGMDPDASNIDGTVTVNFNFNFRDCTQARSCNTIDLYSVILHEFGHTLGWLSGVAENSSTFLPESTWGSTFDRYTLYDRYFLYYGNIQSGPLTHIIDATTPTSPFVDPSIPANALTSEMVWLRNNLMDDPANNQNLPIFGVNPTATGSTPPNTISHFSDYSESYNYTAYNAPGFTPDYVMAPFFEKNQIRNQFTLQELRALNTMNYVFLPSFLSSNSLNPAFLNSTTVANRHPFTTKLLYDYTWFGFGAPYGDAEIDLNAFTPAEGNICNNQTFTIDLSADSRLIDPDGGDPMRIFPGSLYNIRGCGIGGNNHDALIVTSSVAGDIITYTPRPDFVGRAQFAFHLYDGKERGALMLYTIDVTSCNPCATNIVVNGTFEEGMEVKTLTDPAIENSIITFYRPMKYPEKLSGYLADGMIFDNGRSCVVRESFDCTNNDGYFGFGYNSFPYPGTAPLANFATYGDRYYSFTEINNYFRLCSPAQNCTRYTLEFDYNSASSIDFTFGFTDAPISDNLPIASISPINMTLPSTGGAWQHQILELNYCSTTPSEFLVIQQSSLSFTTYLDNLNLYVNPSPPVFNASINPSAATVCENTNVTLDAIVTDPLCNLTYLWQPGALTSSTVIVNPGTTTTTYTLTASDGCTSVISTSTITVSTPPTPTLTIVTPSPICSGTTAVINSSSVSNWYDAPTGGTLLASSTASFTTPSLLSSTTYYVSAVVSGCESPRVAVTVNVIACCTAPYILASNYSTSTTINALGTYYTASALNTIVSGSGTVLILNGMNLQMFPNYKITVQPGATLELQGTNIWACTDYMWDGIDVEAGGKVVMNSNSAIEDAKIAVHAKNVLTTEAKFDISKTTFNKNHKSIVVDPFLIPHTGIVHTSLFTSAASTFPQLGILGGATTLKNPFNTVPARTANMGVEIQNVKAITIGSSAGFNTFNNLEVGIHSYQNTTLTSYNNIFQNIRYGKTCTAALASCYLATTTGMGIWAEKTGTIIVGGAGSLTNKFNLSDNGIVAHNDINVDVQNCTFTNILPPIPALRSRCIYIFSENNPQIITIKDNTFKDFMIGTEINSYFSCQVNIYNNDFKKFNTGVGVLCLQNVKSSLNVEFNHFNNSAADFGYNAIRVQNAVVPTNGATTIYKNDIVNCTIGIKCTKIGKAQIDNINTVKFNLPSAPSVAHFGIWIENGLSNNINNNLVYKTGTTAGSAYVNLLYGYAIDDASFGSLVTNNRAQLLNSGYRFAGLSNNPITYGCNFITKNYTGLELNGTDIGDQGLSPSASPPDGAAQDNQWVYATVSGSPFGIRNIGSVLPTFYSRSTSPLWFPPSLTQQNPVPSLFIGTPIVSSSPYNCTYGCSSPPCMHSPIVKIAKKMAPYNAMSVDNIDLTNTSVYQALKTDTLIYTQGLSDDSVIVFYKDSLATTNVGTLYDVSDKIMLFDSIAAKAKNDGIVPKNCKEQSQKIVNDIYLRSWARGVFEFTPPDSALLQTIADFTVAECGLAVFDARVMLRIDKNDYLVDESRMAFVNNENIEDPYGLMYPNPANTIAYYEIELENEQAGFVELFDVLGNMVASQKLNSGNNKAEFDLNKLSNGIYVYKVTINNEFKTSNKLVITK